MTPEKQGMNDATILDGVEEVMEADALGVSTRPLNTNPVEKSLDRIMKLLFTQEATKKVLDKKLQGSRKVSHVPRTLNSTSDQRNRSRNDQRQKKGYFCGKLGHIQNDCYLCQRPYHNRETKDQSKPGDINRAFANYL